MFGPAMIQSKAASSSPSTNGIGNEVLLAGIVFIGLLLCCIFKLTRMYARYFSVIQEDDAVMQGIVRTETIICAICQQQVTLAVETNCGHVFCSGCVNEYQRTRGNFAILPCPLCRRRVTLIMPYFSEAERTYKDQADIQRRHTLQNFIRRYNQLGSRTVWESFLDIPALVCHIVRCVITRRGLPLYFRFRVYTAIGNTLLYALLPVDLIQELLLGPYCYLDDVVIMATLIVCLITQMRELYT